VDALLDMRAARHGGNNVRRMGHIDGMNRLGRGARQINSDQNQQATAQTQ